MIFIDTWGWLTLRDKRESRHRDVTNLYKNLRRQRKRAYTSDYILDETITLLFRRLPFSKAMESLDHLEQAVEEGYIHLEWVTPDRFDKSRNLRKEFQDKPFISSTDFTSMLIMEELGINKILTEDEHFIQVGMGFRKVPYSITK